MKRILIYSLVILAGIFQSCKEDIIGQPSTDGIAPGQPMDVEVINIPGGAVLKYQLPVDEDLLYAEAQYEMGGKTLNVKASCFEDTMKIEGYADTNVHEVKLFCVDRSGNYSEPVLLNVQPAENPVSLVGKTLAMKGDIGGVHVTWKNTTRTPINVMLYAADSLGKMQLADVVYTSKLEGDFYLRGYDDQRRRFAVLIKDRWDNYSDTLADYFTPRYEELVPKKGFLRYILPEDNTSTMDAYYFSNMFDNIYGGDYNFFHTNNANTNPEHGPYFTIDLGHLVKLTRYKLWQRNGIWYYIHHNPKVWEVYGRAEDPKKLYGQGHYENDTDYWAEGFRTDTQNWLHVAHCITDKPSGFDNPDITAEDREYAKGGHEFIISEDMPAVRYLRFTIDQTWGGGMHPTLLHICELEFYGKIVDKE